MSREWIIGAHGIRLVYGAAFWLNRRFDNFCLHQAQQLFVITLEKADTSA